MGFQLPGFRVLRPRWLALSYVGALYFYQTMDAVDGKQARGHPSGSFESPLLTPRKARRTGSSTPLGHLVDHGCDCLTGMSQAGSWFIRNSLKPHELQFRQHAALVMILMPADMHWVFQCMRSIQPGPRFSSSRLADAHSSF